MTLLNPLLMWGMLAVAAPIIIHLLNRRRFEHVNWAAMRFVQLAIEKNQRRIQTEDIILLLLRCALVALLAWALARPALKAAGTGRFFGAEPVTGVIILDNSYSMSATDGVQSRFEQAKRAADSILDTLPTGSSVALILASDIANTAIPQTFDLNLVRNTIHNLRLSDRSTDIEPSIRAALNIFRTAATASLRKEIYLLTDGQANGWEKMDPILSQLSQARPEIHTQIVLIGSKLDANVGVSDLQLVSDLPVVDLPLTFAATIKNYGSTPSADAHNVRVGLHMDDDPTAAEEVIDVLRAGQSKTVELSAKLHTPGTHTVNVSLPLETDRLPADNGRTLAVRAVKDIHVLMVDGDSGTGGREASTAVLRSYLVIVPPAEQAQDFLKVNTIVPSQMSTQRLDEYSAIILSNVTDLSAPVCDSIANYLRRGLGGLMVFPGGYSNRRFYNDLLVDKYHFLPAKLGPTRGNDDPNNDSIYFTLQGSNFTSEVARMWTNSANGTPATAKIWKAYELTPDTTPRPRADDKAALAKDPWAAEAGVPEVVLSYGRGVGDTSLDAKPAIMERQWGMGRVFEFSSTADRKWNTLPDKPNIYLPLIYKTLGVIVRRQDDQLNIKVGDPFVYHPGEELLGKDATIFRPGQKDSAADARQVEMVNGLPQISFEATDYAGAYEMKFSDAPPVQFAAYADPRESELAELDVSQTQRLSEVATVTRWGGDVPLGASIEKSRVGTELWMTLAMIALILASVESILATWFSRVK